MNNLFAASSCAAVNTSQYIYIITKYNIDQRRASYVILLSTCTIEIPLRTRLRLMTSPGFDSEKLSGFHVCIFQFIVLTKMQFFFGSM